jgi:16S rRNA (adenine1518-N6/adenine1519-N6)-dimethyltransferase
VTHSRSAIAALLARIERRPRQSLGQNFVADANTVRRIVRLAGIDAESSVIEIGAGLGSLTLALAEVGASVTAIEIDGDLVPLLREQVEPLGVRVVHADAMVLDWNRALDEWGIERAVLVANLPYNISTPLICDLLDQVPRLERMLVMVQREVAERLVAGPGTAAYGIPSVKVAYWADAKIVGHVPASVFVPQPKVESSLVQIVRRPGPAVEGDAGVLFALVRAGFGQRRKMLRRSLAASVSADDFACAGVAPDARAEQLSVQEWGALARAVGGRARDRGGEVAP